MIKLGECFWIAGFVVNAIEEIILVLIANDSGFGFILSFLLCLANNSWKSKFNRLQVLNLTDIIEWQVSNPFIEKKSSSHFHYGFHLFCGY
jgi:hypothetical protein